MYKRACMCVCVCVWVCVCVCVCVLLHAARFCIFHFGIFKGPRGRLAVLAKANSMSCEKKTFFYKQLSVLGCNRYRAGLIVTRTSIT